jgi:mRNA degradation ribonuclease J1/J2
MPTGPVLTIHRAAEEIGGNCIELEHDGHRLLLDAGSPLAGDGATDPRASIPRTLDTAAPIAGLVISHPHRDHWGLLRTRVRILALSSDLPKLWNDPMTLDRERKRIVRPWAASSSSRCCSTARTSSD